jgi:uncharacterized membrane protein YsdA (DUF1294 family)/cold shock CspA family protein
MRYQGKITSWKDDQGFGFVIPNGGGEKAFVHIKAFSSRSRRPADGDIITYELTIDGKRRFRADNVRFVDERAASATSSGTRSLGTVFAALFCCFLVLASLMGRLPVALIGVYLGASVIAFIAYATDKSAAQSNRWRTKESTLHLLGLIGGWPGALFAQKTLRHKSKKQEFQMVFWTTVVLNCCALGWLFTKGGSAFIRSIIDLGA